MLFLYNNLACLASLWLLTVPFSCTSSPAISDSLSNFNLYSSYILFFWEYFFPILNIFFFLPLSPYFFLCFSPLQCTSFLFFLFSIFFSTCAFSQFLSELFQLCFLSVSLVSVQLPSLECWQKYFLSLRLNK